MAACGLAAGAQDAASLLTMRGGAEAPVGEIVSVDIDSVTVRQADKSVALSWDRVADVRGPMAEKAKEQRAIAEKAWRARTRLERGDLVAAEPLFDELLKTYSGRHGATAGMVAEGLLRCRLRRGVQTAAVAPWLAWLTSAGDEQVTPVLQVTMSPSAPPLIDPATGLCPSLPPIWLKLPSVEALARGDLLPKAQAPDEDAPDVQAPGVAKPRETKAGEPKKGVKGGKPASAADRVVVLSRLYQVAAAYEAGTSAELMASDVPLRSTDAGIAIVAQIVGARAGDAALRKDARQMLVERLKQHQAQWLEAWLRVGIGRSLLRESGVEDRLLGAAYMLYVPARLRGAAPYLSGVALAEGALLEWANGNGAGAWALKRDLAESLPGHPAIDYEPLRTIRQSVPGRADSTRGSGTTTGAVGAGGPAEEKAKTTGP